jgi:hypothetical protein
MMDADRVPRRASFGVSCCSVLGGASLGLSRNLIIEVTRSLMVAAINLK